MDIHLGRYLDPTDTSDLEHKSNSQNLDLGLDKDDMSLDMEDRH